MESLLEAFSQGGHTMYLILMMDLMIGPAALGILVLSVGARVMGKEGRIARIPGTRLCAFLIGNCGK